MPNLAPSNPTGRGSLRTLRIAVFVGLLAGGLELALLAFRKLAMGRPSFGMDQKLSLIADYRIVWAVPLAETLTMLVPGILLALAVRWLSPQRGVFWSVAILGAMGVWSVLLNFLWLHKIAGLALAVGSGVFFARIAAPRVDAFDRLVSRSLVCMTVTVAAAALFTTWRHQRPERAMLASAAPNSDAPNVVLIILDTVRGFNLSAYGYERETTPNIDRLAKSGTLFEHAYSTAPWTLPSHASMFTGRLPHELSADVTAPLDDTHPTIAEQMRDRGYLTAGFVANHWYCLAESGLNRGFGHYADFAFNRAMLAHNSAILRVMGPAKLMGLMGASARLYDKSADQVNQEFLAWLPRTDGRPYFAFLNYLDAHRPYLPPAPYDKKFSSSRDTRLRYIRQGATSKFPADAPKVFMDAYDESLHYLDDRVGRLVRELAKRDSLRNTIVIITSDHGEQFGERGMYYHANTLYSQLLRVPLIAFGGPRIPVGKRVPHPVSLQDLAPTIVDLAAPGAEHPFPGKSLARFWRHDSLATPAPTLAAELSQATQLIQEFAPKQRGIWSVFVDGKHFIKNGKQGKEGVLVEELYDVLADPREERNLIADGAVQPLLPRMRATLDSAFVVDTAKAPRGGKDSN